MSEVKTQTFEEFWKERSHEVSVILTDLAFKRYNPLYDTDEIVQEASKEMVKIHEIVELAYYRGQVKALTDFNQELKDATDKI